MAEDEKTIVAEYVSTLSDLRVNSKPMISMLTILAEDSKVHSEAVVKAIEDHLQKVHNDVKLPVLYLIDSIIKNVPEPYLPLFANNIVNSFCTVFEKADEKKRADMWKLRGTWSEVFPAKKLFALDLRVHSLDPAWPIVPYPPLQTSKSSHKHKHRKENRKPVTAQPAVAVAVPKPTPVVIPATPLVVAPPYPAVTKVVLSGDAAIQEEIIKKKRELMALQKQKVDLELKKVKADLAQQKFQYVQQGDFLNTELPPSLSDDILNEPVPVITIPNQVTKSLDQQYPAAAASLLKSDFSKSGMKKIIPASSIAIAAAKPISRDPRIKIAPSSENVAINNVNEAAKQQLMQQFKIHMASKLNSEQNALFDDSIKVTNDNKKTKEIITIKKEKDASPPHRNNSIKEHSKSSSKSSSTRGSSSSSSKTSSSPSSSSSRKSGSKSRSKSSSSSSFPPKVPKVEPESPTTSPEKRSSKRSKSRKTRSPSPLPATSNNVANMNYRIPRRTAVVQEVTVVNNNNESIDDDEITVSSDSSGFWPNVNRSSRQKGDDSPISFKEITSNARMRNYIRRNKDGSRSPEVIEVIEKDVDASKDEDLRPPIVNPALSKEDLDLRVLTVPGSKRQSSDVGNAANAKKSKAEKFDALFGNEDVDLRTLTNPTAGRSPTPPKPPPTPSSSSSSWAKLKTPLKQERGTKPLRDQNRQNRQRFNRTPLLKQREIKYEPTDDRSQHNIITIMKQAAEQLADGEITRSQYNTLIQEVMQMNEDQKLKAAQKKEQEIGMSGWEKDDNDENIRINHPPMMGPRGPPGGPRWQGPWHQPWGPPPHPGAFPPNGPPPPGFPPPDGFRPPMGPWQGPRFGGPPPMRPDFPHPPPPFGFNPRMGPPPPMMMPNGPMNVPPPSMNPMMTAGAVPPSMTNGPVRPDVSQPTVANGDVDVAATAEPAAPTAAAMKIECARISQYHSPTIHSGELPAADPKLLEEISKDTMKSINIDNMPREIRYYGNIGVVFMSWDDPRDIGFQGGTRKIFIDGKEFFKCSFNEDYKEFVYDGEIHRIKLGTPTRELYVDDKWYECYFGGRPITVELGSKKVNISLDGPIPQVKIGTVKRTDLVLGKINLIINAKKMVPVFLDAKPQMFEVEGKQCTLEFIDSLQTVLFNGRPFQVVFGGLPRPVIIGAKKHYMRFTVLPRGFSAGFVKITGMKGGQPVEKPLDDSSTVPNENAIMANSANQKVDAIAATAIATTSGAMNHSVPPGLDLDSASQNAMDITSGAKSDSQIDVLSSVVPSAMAPSSGLSYQAEPVENAPAAAPAISLNLNELFQRLVETGIVPSVNNSENSKQKEEEEAKKKKEPDVVEISFDKPETLKLKQQATIAPLYTGMQCSSCGARFTPEMASRYSRHLDWHFRQNRKERDTTRKAHSRGWYYDVADWIQFEEIEDFEDRAQSWFETEKQGETDGMAGEETLPAVDQPSVPTGADEDGICQVCHEPFEQFYNEEKEEWHLRPTVVFEEKNYHPLCLEDHKRALEKSAMVLEEAIAELEKVEQAEEERKAEIKQELTEQDIENQFEEVDMSEVGIDIKTELESDKEEDVEASTTVLQKITKMEVDDMDEDEAIEIIEPTPKKIEFEEIDDSSDDEAMSNLPDGTVKQEKPDTPRKQPEEKIPDDVPLVFEGVKVKQEPIDIESEPVAVVVKPAAVDTTQVAVKSTIDGNVELESAAPTRQTAPSKIKLNISKSLNVQKEIDESKNKDKKKKAATAPAAKALSEPAAVKPALQGKKMSILPTVEKGRELSGLCSIM